MLFQGHAFKGADRWNLTNLAAAIWDVIPDVAWIHLSSTDYHRTKCMQPISALLLEVCAAEASCERNWLRCSQSCSCAAPAAGAATSGTGAGRPCSPWLGLPPPACWIHQGTLQFRGLTATPADKSFQLPNIMQDPWWAPQPMSNPVRL